MTAGTLWGNAVDTTVGPQALGVRGPVAEAREVAGLVAAER
jgi:hypothetical protein